MCRLFKEVTGYSISEYINIHRIQKARHYLENTEFSISEITGLVGYGSMSHFEKNFKAYMNVSPLKYRKNDHVFAPVDLPVNP